MGMGIIVVERHMVERLHLAMAERTVAIAEQIRDMEAPCARSRPKPGSLR
jgi:citrate lyase subunit beta / citryl-CoA lyase